MRIVIGALFACALVGESAFTQAPAAVPTQPASSAGAQGSAAGELAGRWTGKASSGDEGTRITLQVFRRDGQMAAEMTLPDIGVSGWPANRVEQVGKTLRLTFPSDGGPQEMVLEAHDSRLSGQWSEQRYPQPALVELHATSEPGILEERVTVTGTAGRLGASVIMPDGEGPFPGIVFLHGSGPQPRDANRFAAQTFARAGIASIIFDKRGVGESGGELAGASFEDLAADAIAVAEHLKARPKISRVGFFGHSQGGWIGPLAGGRWDPTAFVISSSGPAVPPSREGEWDVVGNLRRQRAGEAAEEKARRVIQSWHEGVRSGEWAGFDSAFSTVTREPWFAASGLSEFASRPDESFSKSYRAFMDYDPIPALQRLRAPLLALLSPDDESIDAVETAAILKTLVKSGTDITIKLYPGYDHTMRRLSAGGVAPRWPELPTDYFDVQSAFIQEAARPRLPTPTRGLMPTSPVPIGVMLVATGAALGPALRAASVDPSQALRED